MVNLLNNRYKLEKILGQGGMGRVYLAQDNRNKEKVAIKQVIIPISAVNKNKFIERFTREYLFLSSINHPNVIKALDFFEENKSLFFVMEFIYGLSLNNFICKKLANLSLLERLAVAIQIARCVEVVNTLGIIHRDIKPANMIVDEKHNLIKLLDFGIAKSTDTSMASLTKTGTQIGTPAYMSPEQVNGNVCENSDVFSVGVVLYQIFLGLKSSPFKGRDILETLLNVCEKQLPEIIEKIDFSIDDIEKDAYKKISILITRTLEKEAKRREAKITTVAEELKQIYENLSTKKTLQNKVSWQTTAQLKVNSKFSDKLNKKATVYGVKKVSKKNFKISTKTKIYSCVLFVIIVTVISVLTQSKTNYGLKDYSDSRNLKTNNLSGEETKKIIALVKTLSIRNRERKITTKASESLVSMGPIVVPVLLQSLSDQNELLRMRIIQILGKIGGKAKQSTSTLAKIILDRNETTRIRSSAIYAIGKISHQSEETLKMLTNIIFDEDEITRIRSSAIHAVGKTSHQSEETLKMLTNIVSDRSKTSEMRSSAVYTLGEIISNYSNINALSKISLEVTKILHLFLKIGSDKTQDSDVRCSALDSITEIYPKTPNVNVISALTTLIYDSTDHPEVRSYAIDALVEIFPQNKKITPMLLEIVSYEEDDNDDEEDDDEEDDDKEEEEEDDYYYYYDDLRDSAEEALITIKPDASKTAPKLISNLSSQDQNVIESSRNILREAGIEAVPFLIEALSSTTFTAKRYIVQILIQMDTKITPLLLKELQNENQKPDTKEYLEYILQKIKSN